ncbi:hypothetical protein OGAPHI_003652 [Ogataea philodendri]|uniref:Ribosome quality control complex subunit 2 n=1 Tax=Ogataea philodendri TaxID=1378263 RepID=A0A9P8P448_9ASCO|nr:uncharacterized protein OGAPHI_003652 [Ogataea philodendri]KAH3665468.1 hypothetical protein OGAPHI_003652 [Ogataea philodendri]
MKQRVSALDLRLLVKEIADVILGTRLQNVYNLVTNSRSFLLKFSVPDAKANLVIESGFKVYLTEFQRPTTPEPSNFAAKLRKHIKSKRLSNIKQVGTDRVVVLEFADGLYYLVLEFFSAGNIILLDADRKILSVFRLVDEHENNDRYAVGVTYTMFDRTLFEDEPKREARVFTAEEVTGWIRDASEGQKPLTLSKLLFSKAAYLSSDLIQIELAKNSVAPSLSSVKLLDDAAAVANVVRALNSCENQLSALDSAPPGSVSGYIIGKQNPYYKPEQEVSYDNLEFVYDEFHPYVPEHKLKEDVKIEQVRGYNKTLDKFFSTLESSKSVLKAQQQEANAAMRLQMVKDDQQLKIKKLEDQKVSNYQKGELITVHSSAVDQCKQTIQTLLDQQMDWKNIEKLVSMEQRRKNPIAQMIKLPLNLAKNEITVILPQDQYDDSSDSDSEDENAPATVDVTIDLGLTAFANATRYFDAMRTASDKQTKTKQSASLAIKNTEKTIMKDMKKIQKKAQEPSGLKQIRPKFWFEKFFWFVSGDGLLCIAGRDDTQTDLIYYRYFNKATDVLVSNDLDGLKVFVKNPFKNKDIPHSTLLQAGTFSLSTSKAWDNKMVVSPWMVTGAQVTKKDFDSSLVPAGMFNIKGDKTFLPPCHMVMGFGLLWLGDQETAKKYEDAAKARNEDVGLEIASQDSSVDEKVAELTSLLEKMGVEEEQQESGGEAVEEVVEEPSEPSEPAETASPAVNTNVRGKKSKLKKIKQKYKDQDEEERLLKMEALGVLKQKKETVSTETQQEIVKPVDKVTRKKQQDSRLLRKLISELEDSGEDVETKAYYEIVSGLISAPKPTDTIANCILVFAPYSALTKYTYKVKVQPGPLKKGKALGEAMRVLQSQTQSLKKDNAPWTDSKNLMENINQQDSLLNITVSKLKLSGGANDKSNAKKGRK